MRIIDDETYAAIIKLLTQDQKVALFQRLLLAQKADPVAEAPDEIKTESEVKK